MMLTIFECMSTWFNMCHSIYPNGLVGRKFSGTRELQEDPAARELTRRDFLFRSASTSLGLLFVALLPARAEEPPSRRMCERCGSTVKPEFLGKLTHCPGCGREWQTGEWAISPRTNIGVPTRHASETLRWDYTQVPFPNFKYLEHSDKPVLSIKKLKFYGRVTA